MSQHAVPFSLIEDTFRELTGTLQQEHRGGFRSIFNQPFKRTIKKPSICATEVVSTAF